jgi:hypothetical protein
MNGRRNPATRWTRRHPGELPPTTNILLILFIITSPYEQQNCVLIVLKEKYNAIMSAYPQVINFIHVY